MVQKVELRVHASAVTTRKADNIYRAQAEAYTKFRGHRIDLKNVTDSPGSPATVSQGPGRDSRDWSPDPDPTVYIADTQQAWLAVQSNLFTSSLLVPPSDCSTPPSGPRHLQISQVDGGLNRFSPSVQSLDSQRSRSSYLRSPDLEGPSKTRCLDREPQPRNSPTSPCLPSLVSSPEDGAVSIAHSRDYIDPTWQESDARHASAIDKSQSSQATSQLPASYDLSQFSSQSSRAQSQISPGSSSRARQSTSEHLNSPRPQTPSTDKSGTHSPESQPKPTDDEQTIAVSLNSQCDRFSSKSPIETNIPSQNPPSEEHNGLIAKSMNDRGEPSLSPSQSRSSSTASRTTAIRDFASKTPPRPPPPPSTFLQLSTQMTTPANPDITAPTGDSDSNLDTFTCALLPTLLLPPQPKTSIDTGPMLTHVTKSLHSLATHPIRPQYKPVLVTRELQPCERGAWTFDPSHKWDLQKQVKFWRFLEQMIKGGSLGWGVWACREECGGKTDGGGEESPSGLGPVRVYCWGEVVKHVYFLLYVASDSKARKMGLQWVDAQGLEVVRMPGENST